MIMIYINTGIFCVYFKGISKTHVASWQKPTSTDADAYDADDAEK